MPKILIVEDDTRVAELLKRGLDEEGFETQVAYDGEMGRKLCQSNIYDLMITDIILPKISGLELCQIIKNSNPRLPIIMLTALGTTNDKVDGFDAGADDYLVKPFDFRELLARIRALLKRSAVHSSYAEKSSYLDLEVDHNTKTIKRAGKEIRLTPKEFKLMEYMIQNPERVLTRTEIAEKVWNTHFDTGTNFIDVYINYLRKKIDKDFNNKLIHTKSGMGFILKNGEE